MWQFCLCEPFKLHCVEVSYNVVAPVSAVIVKLAEFAHKHILAQFISGQVTGEPYLGFT